MQINLVGSAINSRFARAAGTIASRNGSAMAAPAPRRKVRRGRWLPVMKFIGSVSLGVLPFACRFRGCRLVGLIGIIHGFREFHAERVALHNAEDERGNLITARFGGLRNR